VNYNPGGASFDLVQGLYLVKAFATGTTTPVWQEQITVRPGDNISRNLSLTGVNSTSGVFSNVTLTVNNNVGAQIQVYQGSTSLGLIVNGSSASYTVQRCSRIIVRNTSTNLAVDSFIMPNGSVNRRYNTTCNMTFTNTNLNYATVAIYSDGLLIGTVTNQTSFRVKTLPVVNTQILTYKDQNNNIASATNPAGSSFTVNCSTLSVTL